MVIRSSPRDAAFRAYHGGGARAIIDKVDDKTLMQEHSGSWMKGESRKGVESPQNYGFTSLVTPADKGEDGKPEMGAEAFVHFAGGNRSMPHYGPIDDRRHRLRSDDKTKMEEGDTAMYRTKDDRQQFHMSKTGNYLTCRDDRVNRTALVPKPDDDKQQKPQAGTQAAGGGASGGGGQQQQKSKKPTGQTHQLDANKKSEIAIEQNGQTTFSQHGEAYGSQKGGSDSTVHYEKDKKKSAQSTEKHTHIRWKEHRIWNEEDGNFWTIPCLVKKDQHCKEG